MQFRNGIWSLCAIYILGIVGFLFAVAIVLSLIPLYLSSNTNPFKQNSGTLLTLSYNISADQLNVSLPLTTVPESALKFLQNNFQQQLDSDSQTAGSKGTVESAELHQLTSSGRKKRQTISIGLITLIVRIRLFYSRTCQSVNCQIRTSTRAVRIVLVISSINFAEFQAAILAGVTTTTTGITSTSTTAIVTSGGLGSFSPNPMTTVSVGRRRRRSIVSPFQSSSHMPIGGCLLISLHNATNIIDNLRRESAFLKHLPLAIQSIRAIDGQEIDLYSSLREQKLLKTSYNRLVTQDHLVTGQDLTLGSLGCFESHVRAWEKVVQVNRPMLIFEDDVHLNGQLFDAMLPYILYALPTNFSLLYFGNLIGQQLQSQLIDYNELLWKVDGSTWGTYAYLISPQAAAILLDFIYPVQVQIDSMIISIALSQSLDVFMSKEVLVKTDNTFRRISKTQRYIVPPIVIPRVLHFIWLSNSSLPTAAQGHIDLWSKLHPKWQIRLWTNESILNSDLIMYNKHRWANSHHAPRQASDILRYEIIYQYGGIYVDVDFEPLKSIEPLLHDVQAFVAHENEPFVCNGLFGAVPGHELTKRLVIELESSMIAFENGTVNQQTGPYHMTRQVKAMQEEGKTTMKDGFQVFSPHLFFPYSWIEQDPGHPYDSLAFAVHHFRPIADIERDAREGH